VQSTGKWATPVLQLKLKKLVLDKHQRKKELRQTLLERRKSISEPDYYGASADIIEQLKEQHEYQNAHTIHCYVSINKRREVETRELVKEMLFKGKKVIVPITDFENGILTHIHLTSFEDLKSNKWGVPEPNDGKEVSSDELELVIVPMVGGDEQCNRIGYGEGFYDRFLKEVTCPKIGLIFEQNVIEEIPVEEFDIPLDKIITEERIIIRD
jgi:5-formyltetrahydrofolate cyclo-ligase